MRWIVYTNETYYPDAEFVEAETAREAVEKSARRRIEDLDTDYFAVPADAATWFGPLGARAFERPDWDRPLEES